MSHRAALCLLLLLLTCLPGLVSAIAQDVHPQDKPVTTDAEQRAKLQRDIAPYVKEARETLPKAKKKYLAGLPQNQTFFVTIKLYDAQKFEQVFVRVTSWNGKTIQGVLASDLSLIHNHTKGEALTCKESEVLDWTISKPDGTEEGNFVGKFLDAYQP